MKPILKMIYSSILNIYCKIININRCRFGRGTRISKKTVLEGNNIIGKNTNFVDSKMGYSSYISHYCDIPNTNIGRFCSIGKNVKIIYGTHPTERFVSTSPLFYSTKSTHNFKKIFTKEDKFEEYKFADGNKYVKIENDVWIGDNVSIMQGITIGNGVIIGANSIVTKELPSYAIAAGNPAKVIRFRFTEEQIEKLEELKWWEKSVEWIEHYSEQFDNADRLIEKWDKDE